jgi:hypothetical protein
MRGVARAKLLSVAISAFTVGIATIPTRSEAQVTSVGRVRAGNGSTMCFDLPNPTGVWPSTNFPAPGTSILIYVCHGNPNQQFTMIQAGDQVYQLKSAWSGQCVNASPNGSVTVQSCVNTNRQQLFTVIASGSGTYEFRALESDFAFPTNVKCLDVQGGGGSPPNATPIINFPCHANSYITAPNQTFFLDANPGTGPVGRYLAPHDPRRGRISISYSDGTTGICSGTVVAAPNKSIVATAKHCVVKTSNGATMVSGWFIPGYDLNINPPNYQGHFHLDTYVVGSTDTAFIRVGGKYNSNWSWNGALVENAVGSFAPAFVGSATAGESVRITGHPSNNGATQMAFTCEGVLTFTVINSVSSYSRRCNGGPGISGSGWIIAGLWRAATSGIEAPTIGSIYGSAISGVRYLIAPPVLTATDAAAFNSIKN